MWKYRLLGTKNIVHRITITVYQNVSFVLIIDLSCTNPTLQGEITYTDTSISESPGDSITRLKEEQLPGKESNCKMYNTLQPAEINNFVYVSIPMPDFESW
jgi:hypothetical protein